MEDTAPKATKEKKRFALSGEKKLYTKF